MWGFATDYLKNALMATGVHPVTLYVGIGTSEADPSYTDTIGEPSDTAYARYAYTSSIPTNWLKVGPGRYRNVGMMSFGTMATAAWGWVQSFALFDATDINHPPVAGNALFAGQLRNPVYIGPGSPPLLILPGQMEIALLDRGHKQAGCVSDYFVDYIMSHLLNGTSWTALATWAALSAYLLTPGVQPAALTDVITPATGGYNRLQFGATGVAMTDLMSGAAINGLATAINAGILTNTGQFLFGPPTANWAWAPCYSVWDQSTWSVVSPGHWLWAGRLKPPQLGLANGPPIIIPPYGFKVGFGDER